MNKYIVIIAGGVGERFWPKSRHHRPKHLLPIVGKDSMLEQTLKRLETIVPAENLFIITNKEQVDAVRAVCPQLPADQIVAEPIGRDTAAATGLALFLVKQKDPEGRFAILPADHVIEDVDCFHKTLESAFTVADEEAVLVTLGITPQKPATGYGYIKRGETWKKINGIAIDRVEQFVEKPDIKKAEAYLASGEYFWNTGMFVWQVATIEAALKKHCSALYESLGLIEGRLENGELLDAILADVYPKLDKISIDYAVMEKADNVVTVESSFDWDDVGEWSAIERHYETDSQGNVVQGDVILEESSNNIVLNEQKHLTALIGVEGMIVVQTEDATLICPKDKAQEIKKLVKRISEDKKYQSLV